MPHSFGKVYYSRVLNDEMLLRISIDGFSFLNGIPGLTLVSFK
jgi:hypothetical protein